MSFSSNGSESSDSELENTPQEILDKATLATDNLLPSKSRQKYEKCLESFKERREANNIPASSFSDNVLLVYFEESSKTLKPSTLWTRYSMLRSRIIIKHQIDISKYSKLIALLKRKSEGFKGKKSKTFTSEEIKMFLDEAPDDKFLLIKVVLIVGIMGACRRIELHQLQVDDAKFLESTIVVTIPNTINNTTRTFTITGKYSGKCKIYMNLRPVNCTSPFFFLNYFGGRCTNQHVGINKLGNVGKQIATHLQLPHPNAYTGHCFRRSSATILVDAGGDITTLKRHGGWRSTSVAEGYIDDSLQNKMKVSNTILNSIENTTVRNEINVNATPSTSSGPRTTSGITFNNCTIQNLNVYKSS